MQNAAKRFWNKVKVGTETECWPWRATTTQGGYGIFRINTQKRCSAARFAYTLTYGELEKDLAILHLCHNKLCCNPLHLYAGTVAQNNLHDSVDGKLQSNSPTNVVGVRWREEKGAWQAQGTVDGKSKVLYHGESFEAAVLARKTWEDRIKAEKLPFISNQLTLEVSHHGQQ